MQSNNQCPFFKKECIKNDCALWLKNVSIRIQKDSEEKKVAFDPMCALVASGVSALQNIGMGKAGITG